MNIMIIPSWYPSKDEPITGIFFKEQAILYAQHYPNDNVVIANWGPNDHRLLLTIKAWPLLPSKLLGQTLINSDKTIHLYNCVEYFFPAFTWTRKIFWGNIIGIYRKVEAILGQAENDFGKINMIHAHTAYPAGFVAHRIRKKHNIPFVVSEHMAPFPFDAFIKKKLLHPVIKVPLENANKVFAVSSHLKKELSSFKIKSEVSPNFIDTTFFTPSGKPQKTNYFTFLNIGRLTSQKSQKTLLQAASSLKYLKFKLIIIGAGPLESELKTITSTLGLKGIVEFKGQLSRVEVLHFLRKSDSLLVSSLFESQGVAVMEALSCGIPVITTLCGGPSDLVNDDNGFIIPVDDPMELAAAMRKMIGCRTKFRTLQIRNNFLKAFNERKILEGLRRHYVGIIQQLGDVLKP